MRKKNRQYLQLAFNHTFGDFKQLISYIPTQDNIIIEAGTPFLKRYGIGVIPKMKQFWSGRILADLKVTDGAKQEVAMAAQAGADLVTADGAASEETLQLFVETCHSHGLDSVIDMLNVERPMKKLWQARTLPEIVLIHLGRDEENSYGKVIRYRNIAKIKGKWSVLCGAAGGIDQDELSSALFNGADVVVVNAVKESDPWAGITIDAKFQTHLKELLNLLR